MLGLVILVLLAMIFRNGNPDKNFIVWFSDFSGIDPTAPKLLYPLRYRFHIVCRYVLTNLLSNYLLHLFLFINKPSLVIVFLTIASATFMALEGFSFGIRKTQMWAISVFTMWIFDMLIVETIHVILHAFIVKIYLKVSRQKMSTNSTYNSSFRLHLLDWGIFPVQTLVTLRFIERIYFQNRRYFSTYLHLDGGDAGGREYTF